MLGETCLSADFFETDLDHMAKDESLLYCFQKNDWREQARDEKSTAQATQND